MLGCWQYSFHHEACELYRQEKACFEDVTKVVLVAATYFLALGTYYFVERPTRRRVGIVPPIIVSGAAVACVALWMATYPRYYDTTGYSEARYVTFDCILTIKRQRTETFRGLRRRLSKTLGIGLMPLKAMVSGLATGWLCPISL